MFLHRLVDWQAKSLSTCWKLIWSFASGTAYLNSVLSGDVPSQELIPFSCQQNAGGNFRPLNQVLTSTASAKAD
jgi:hypothetical protein